MKIPAYINDASYINYIGYSHGLSMVIGVDYGVMIW